MFKDIWNVYLDIWRVYYGITQVQLWYNRFKEDREDDIDYARPDCSSTSTTDGNIEAVNKMIFYNRRISIKEVADSVDISFGLCQAIFTDVLGMKCAAEKIIPKLLYIEKNQCRMDIAQEMLAMFKNNSDLFKKVITGDESWLYGYDIEIKA